MQPNNFVLTFPYENGLPINYTYLNLPEFYPISARANNIIDVGKKKEFEVLCYSENLYHDLEPANNDDPNHSEKTDEIDTYVQLNQSLNELGVDGKFKL